MTDIEKWMQSKREERCKKIKQTKQTIKAYLQLLRNKSLVAKDKKVENKQLRDEAASKKRMEDDIKLKENAPAWTSFVNTFFLVSFYHLLIKFLCRNTPVRSGRNIGRDVEVDVSDYAMSGFINNYNDVPSKTNKVKTSPSTFPYTGDTYLERTWIFESAENIENLLNIFAKLHVYLHTIWVQDRIQQGKIIRIDDPKNSKPFLLKNDSVSIEETKEFYKKNGIDEPMRQPCCLLGPD